MALRAATQIHGSLAAAGLRVPHLGWSARQRGAATEGKNGGGFTPAPAVAFVRSPAAHYPAGRARHRVAAYPFGVLGRAWCAGWGKAAIWLFARALLRAARPLAPDRGGGQGSSLPAVGCCASAGSGRGRSMSMTRPAALGTRERSERGLGTGGASGRRARASSGAEAFAEVTRGALCRVGEGWPERRRSREGWRGTRAPLQQLVNGHPLASADDERAVLEVRGAVEHRANSLSVRVCPKLGGSFLV